MTQPAPVRPPDLAGAKGKAWLLAEDAGHASLRRFLVYAPDAHPCWSYYLVGVCHLRDAPGLPKAEKSYPEAAFELRIDSLADPAPLPDQAIGWTLLLPPDLVHQFHGPTDDGAAEVCSWAVSAIVTGRLSLATPVGWYEALRTTVSALAPPASPIRPFFLPAREGWSLGPTPVDAGVPLVATALHVLKEGGESWALLWAPPSWEGRTSVEAIAIESPFPTEAEPDALDFDALGFRVLELPQAEAGYVLPVAFFELDPVDPIELGPILSEGDLRRVVVAVCDELQRRPASSPAPAERDEFDMLSAADVQRVAVAVCDELDRRSTGRAPASVPDWLFERMAELPPDLRARLDPQFAAQLAAADGTGSP